MATGGEVSGRKEDLNKPRKLMCHVCANRNKISPAEKYCIQCQDFYCHVCVQLHTQVSIMMGHTLVDKDDLPTELCEFHPTKLVDLYCPVHDKVGCCACMSLKHTKCPTIYIPDRIDDLYKIDEVKASEKKLTAAVVDMEEALNDESKAQCILKTKTSMAMEMVKTTKDELLKTIDQLEKLHLKDIAEKSATLGKDIEQNFKDVPRRLGLTEPLLEKMKITRSGKKIQQFVCMKLVEDAMSNIMQNSQPAFKIDTIFNFCPEKSLLRNLQMLGSLESTVKIDVKKHNTQTDKPSPNAYLSEYLNSYDPFFIGTLMGYIPKGCCSLPDGTFLLCSNDKCRVIHLNTSSKKTDYLEVPGEAFAVCSLGGNEAAFTIPSLHTVLLISVNKTMKTLQSLKLSHSCYAISSHDGKLFVSSEVMIHVYTRSGVCVKTLPNAKHSKFFSNVQRMTINELGQSLYVADANLGVSSIDCETGDIVWTYNDRCGDNVTDVCRDGIGSIFVCCSGRPYRILQISEQGQYISTLDEGGHLKAPTSLCYEKSSCTLLLMSYDGEVRLYRLKHA